MLARSSKKRKSLLRQFFADVMGTSQLPSREPRWHLLTLEERRVLTAAPVDLGLDSGLIDSAAAADTQLDESSLIEGIEQKGADDDRAEPIGFVRATADQLIQEATAQLKTVQADWPEYHELNCSCRDSTSMSVCEAPSGIDCPEGSRRAVMLAETMTPLRIGSRSSTIPD